MKDKKQKIFTAIRAVSFLLVLALVFSGLSVILVPKDNSKEGGIFNPNARGFYSEPKNSIELFVVGNSDAYSGYSPMEMWHKYGYATYVAGEGAQRVSSAYRMLCEIFKYQSPKIIILETDMIFTGGGKLDTYEVLARDTVQMMFPVFLNHDIWKKNNIDEVFDKSDYTTNYFSKGQYIIVKVKPNSDNYYKLKNKKFYFIDPFVKIYLDMFVAKCKEKNVELLFVQFPSASSWNNSKRKIISEYAKENGITFLDLDTDRDKLGLDWKTDSRDSGNHLNVTGAKKLTLYLGKYLSKNYVLTDKRDSSEMSSWNDDYAEYVKFINKKKKEYFESMNISEKNLKRKKS